MAGPSTSGSEKDITAKVMQECEDLWLDINKLQGRVSSHTPTVVDEDDDASSIISVVKVKALKGQLTAVAEKELTLLPTDPDTLRALLREEIQTSVQQLEQTLEVVQGQRRELEEEIKWEKQTLEQQKQIQEALQRKIESAKDSSRQPRDSAEAKLLTTKRRMEEEIMRLMRELKAFTEKQFPHPDEVELAGSDGPDGVLSLLDVVENLMNQCVARGSSPYIELNDTYWPPYIELLLRCGIVQRHEQNANLVRLTPFHMR